jgi:hypothetical protein
VFLLGALKMRFIFKFVLLGAVFFSLTVLAQPLQPYLIGSPLNCIKLPNHEAIQECQAQEKAQGQAWEKQMKEHVAPPPPRLNGVEKKPPMNCFKRESTGEQVCAN